MRNASRLGISSAASLLGFGILAILAACASSREGFAPQVDAGPETPSDPFTEDGGFAQLPDTGTVLPEGETRDPVDCEEAKTSKSYVGCDYWPTVTPNPVWSIFDYAVVVANTGTAEANVTVTGPSSTNQKVSVPAGELRKVYLPWVPELKGTDFDQCGRINPAEASVVVPNGAFHLVSSAPVIVYQFNALEYEGVGGQTPAGGAKDWSSCVGTTTACTDLYGSAPIGCFSFSNDASLLLPSTAMTNNYRVGSHHGGSSLPDLFGDTVGLMPAVLSVTATEPGTEVTFTLSDTASVVASVAGQSVTATSGGNTLKLTLANAGDVAQLLTKKGAEFDFSGSLVQSDKPVQVIASIPCTNIPADKAACDHIEETVLPAETLGKHYVIAAPTGPKGTAVEHVVRFYGNKDGTKLTYAPSRPSQCPNSLAAGEVGECALVDQAFEVTGDNEFGVATFLLGAQALDSTIKDRRGDPSQSGIASVEQFRTKYVFLAPTDYPVRFADVVAVEGADVEIDGVKANASWKKIGSGPFGVIRVDLTKSGKDGAHALTASSPVGVQILGYGDNTSFQYPAGLNLKLISAPPPPPK